MDSIILYIPISLYISWIWVDYFRLIDVYQRLSLKYILPTFIMGGVATLGLVWVQEVVNLSDTNTINGEFGHDFRYAVLNIGLVEELTKMLPFAIVMLLFKKQLKEPIDYIIFACVAGLGFAMVENILYIQNYGGRVLISRAVMPTISHMFNTSIVAYGIVRYQYHPSKPHFLTIGLYLILAAVSHGVYDFWLMFPGSIEWHMEFVTTVYFLLTVSWFATILNNSTNNSSYFTYAMVIPSGKVANRLILYYLIVILIQLSFIGYDEGLVIAFILFFPLLTVYGITIGVICIRLSRFKLIKQRWFKLKLQLPVVIGSFGDSSNGFAHQVLRIRGESLTENEIAKYYNQFFEIKPLSNRNTFIGEEKTVYLEDKIFLKDDDSFFVIQLYDSLLNGNYKHYLVKYKSSGKTTTADGRPIAGLLAVDSIDQLTDTSLTIRDFKFVEWITVQQSPESLNLSYSTKTLGE
jgi:RsiW-degrading membrane proteinase PrsW (M82 family)